MSDVICPKCKAENYICHDDGYKCAEGVTYEKVCGSCEQEFKFSVYVSYKYETTLINENSYFC